MKTEVQENYKEFKSPDLEGDNHINKLQENLYLIDQKINNLLKIEEKTYDNFYVPYNMVFEEISNQNFYLSHINSVKNTDRTKEIVNKSLPILSEWSSKNAQREDIYEALNELLETDLTPAQKRSVEESLLSKKLSGVGLETDLKNKIKDINMRLSQLRNDYSNNLLDSTNKYKLVITNPEDVKEFPEDELKRHECENGNGWEFTLQAPSYSAYMKYGNNSNLRKELKKEYVTRSPENEEVIEELLTLKRELSELLGYKDYTEISLLTKMANDSDQVIDFLNNLKDKSLPIAEKEDQELLEFTRSEYGYKGDYLKTWDKSYYSNKYQEQKFKFKSEELKPYFEQSKVLDGLFNFLNEKFEMEFKEVTDTYIWDEKVRVFDIYRRGEEHSRVYFDLEARDDKRGGAWFSNSESYYELNDIKRTPVAYVTCNFTPSKDDLPSLLTHYEVVTLWHEMGHALQHICSEIKDPMFSGINGIEWDAVEWSSQFLELFAYEDDVLRSFAHHYETGEVIPDELIEKLNTIKSYMVGNMIKRQVSLSLFDMEIHKLKDTSKENVQDTLTKIRKDMNIQSIEGDKFQNGFQHIFGGGYSAGYYSYKWAEVLSIDAFIEFNKRNNPSEYYDKFLSKGSYLTSMEMFESYMGRKPNENSLIEYYLN